MHPKSLYFSRACYFNTEIKLKVSMASPKQLPHIYSPIEVLATDYDTHFYHFFSATTDGPTYVV